MTTRRRSSGFTLIETMIVAAIAGVLASVAIPEYGKLNVRARTAERRTIMTAITRCMSDVALNSGAIPTMTGDWNPPGAPKPWKRPFNSQQANWPLVHLEIEGQVYYSYKFISVYATPPTLDVKATGDLDGDGVESVKTISYVAFGNAYEERSEDPREGSEDATTF